MGAADAEEQLSVDDFTLRSQLVADHKAAAIRKAEEERLAEVERLCIVSEGEQKKKERKEAKEAKKRQDEEKRKAGEKRKEKEAGPSGAGKRVRPIGPGGNSSDEGDETEGESSKPKKKKAKKVDMGAEFLTKCESCEKKGIPCLRLESNKGHACKACYASKIQCSLGLDGAASGPAGSTEIVEALARFEQEFVAHNDAMESHEKKMRELVRVNQTRTEAAIGQPTAETSLDFEKKGKGKGKGMEPEVEDRGEGPSGSA
ncbi:hypothetical protein B0H19DRAFT_1085211 [Mycena capillaripes]|nr:hypothetical protein B0H19DRAFT_1085211 [Mycena capillaripes]